MSLGIELLPLLFPANFGFGKRDEPSLLLLQTLKKATRQETPSRHEIQFSFRWEYRLFRKLVTDLTFDDLSQSDILRIQLFKRLDQRTIAMTQLPYSTRNHIDQNVRIANYFLGFFYIIFSQRCLLIDRSGIRPFILRGSWVKRLFAACRIPIQTQPSTTT